MPQKRNPISSELILAAAKIVRQQAGLMLDALVTDFERATGPWHAEWAAIPEACLAASSALHQAKFMLGGLVVDAARMRRNLDITSGLIVAEAVMMGLAPMMGRQVAHDVVYDSCRAAAERGISLLDALTETPEVTKHLDRPALARLCDPANYLGLAPQMVDRVLAGRA
jgi:3-carboxy-cis,cis-muconate cycloisomerase